MPIFCRKAKNSRHLQIKKESEDPLTIPAESRGDINFLMAKIKEKGLS
jgi:hypothetical protein